MKYKLSRSDYGVSAWHFQNRFFTMRSSFSVVDKTSYEFVPVCTNVPIMIRNAAEEAITEDEDESHYSLELTNLMPIVDEPLMGSRLDNLIAVRYRYKSFSGRESHYGWNYVGEWADKFFESEVNKSLKKIKKTSDSLCEGLETEPEKIQHLYDYVAEEITTDDDMDEAGKLHEIMTAGKGNSFEKNVLLKELLCAQDIPAKLLYIGTRKEYGKVNVYIRNLSQFNRLLCYVDYDSTGYTLNPAADCATFPYPTSQDLAEQGLLLDGKESKLLNIPHRERTNGRSMGTSLYINDDGSAVCSTTIVVKGYSMQKWCKMQSDSLSDEEIVEDLLENLEVDYEIVDASLEPQPEKDRLCFNIVLDLPDFAVIEDGNLFFGPVICPLEDNLFESDSRMFPIDFNYTFKHRHTTQIYMPENMTADDLPKNVFHEIQDGMYSRRVLTEANQIIIKEKLEIKKPLFSSQAYKMIKSMYEIISESIHSQVLASVVVEEGGSR